MFNDRSILVTGGTGSFGRRFVRHVLDSYSPARLVVYSRDELKQYDMASEFADHPKSRCLRFFIGDVRDAERLSRGMEGIDFVVHAAALKQVPTAEYNPIECIYTNVHGAENVIRACLEHEVKRIVALSTDKAAKPVNLYGATKLASDKLFVAANNIVGKRETRFAVVRYGNVVGSRGSVVPLFRRLVAEGAGELPITDPRMTRFWITLDQGVQFMLKSFERMVGGEVFVPKIPSTTVIDLALAIAPDLPQRVVGIRPGEKVHEVMCPEEDARQTIEFDDHYVIAPSITFHDRDNAYDRNPLGETGRPVDEEFEYSSGTNPHILKVPEIQALLSQAGV